MSQTTKRALAASLKKLAADKPLDKITISDITDDCEVNRQTFYYHFQDIYDLVEWIFESDSIKAIGGNNTYDTWQEGYLRVFEYVIENKSFVLAVYKSVCREHLEQYLCRETYRLLINVVNERAKEIPVRDSCKEFVANFYKFAFVGLLIEWLTNGMKEPPSEIIERLDVLIHGNFAKALKDFQTKA